MTDLDADGRQELVVWIHASPGSRGPGHLEVWRLSAGGGLARSSAGAVWAGMVDLEPADLDGDGAQEVLVQGVLPGERVFLLVGGCQSTTAARSLDLCERPGG